MKNLEQGSDEWKEARSGLLTASNFGAAIGINPYQSRQKLWAEMVGDAEPFTGNEMTEYGTEHEPDAIFEYESWSGNFVERTGFWVNEEYPDLGCSPDGLVGKSGLVEAKCPFKQIPHEEIPAYYMAQMQGQMLITKRVWCDFVSWSPDDTRIWRVDYSHEYVNAMIPLLGDFWESVQKHEKPKRRKAPEMPAVGFEVLR